MSDRGLQHRVEQLKAAGLRPTRQRLGLAELLFGKGERHLTAEMLHAEALESGMNVSLATVYNTIRHFTEAGFLREVAVEGARSYFDTNTSNHYHFYYESEGVLVDIDPDKIRLENLPAPPDGTRISRVDVLIRVDRR